MATKLRTDAKVTTKVHSTIKALWERDAARAFLLYSLFLALFYGPVLFTGKTLQPVFYQPGGVTSEGVYGNGGDGAEGRVPVNSFNVDLATPANYEWPVKKMVGDMYKRGTLPLWNPYQAGGTPLGAQYSTKAFFPYQVIEDMSPPVTWDFFLLGRLLIAGFFTYLFLSTLGLAFTPAFAGGLFYIFSGSFVWFINLEMMANGAMVIPMAMWSMERLSRGADGGGVVFAGVAFALLILGGQPEVALYGSLLAFCYFLFRTLRLKALKTSLNHLVRFAASYALALALAAPLVVPFLEHMVLSHHIHPPGGVMGVQALQNPMSAVAIITPGATVFPRHPESSAGLCPLVNIDGDYFGFHPINGVWDHLGGYTGIAPVFFIFTALVLCFAGRGARWQGALLFFATFTAVILLKHLGVRPFLWLGHLPLFDLGWSLRWAGPTWVFAAASAVAVSIQIIMSGAGRGARSVAKKERPFQSLRERIYSKAQAAPAVTLVIITAALTPLLFMPVLFATIDRATVFNEMMLPFVVPSITSSAVVTALTLVSLSVLIFLYLKGGMKKHGLVYGAVAAGALELWWSVPRGYEPQWILMKWAPFAVGLVVVILLALEKKRAFYGLTLLFFISTMALDGTAERGMPLRADPFPDAPYVGFLKSKAGEYRTMGGYGALHPNSAAAYGFMDVRYLNSLTVKEYHDFRVNYLQASLIDEEPVSSLWFTGRPERCMVVGGGDGKRGAYVEFAAPVEEDIRLRLDAYSFMGVRYILLPPGKEMSGMELIYDKEVRIFENRAALPRAFVAGSYEIRFAGDHREIQREASKSGFAPSLGVIADRGGVPWGERLSKEHRVEGEGRWRPAHIVEYSPNRVVIEAESAGDGMLVLTDVFYPGWSATVNGEKAVVYRVNGLVRGVTLEGGRSEVVFTYMPVTFVVGGALFMGALIVSAFFFYRGATAVSPAD